MELESLRERLGVSVSDELLNQALTHRSYSYENHNSPNNERLEFLGDTVLGFVVTTHIYSRFPDLAEGELTKIKNAVVSAKALAPIGRELKLGEHLVLGKGEESSGGRDKDNLISDAVEAVLGAVYLEHGLDAAASIIERMVFPLLDNHLDLISSSDPKTQLQEYAQAKGIAAPNYSTEFVGPDHDREFTTTVVIGEVSAIGIARSRKNAEAAAAAKALELLGVQ